MLQPKGVMLWSKNTLSVFDKRCKNDMVYLDATGCVIQKKTAESPPYYVYELVVRNPSKGSSPLPVATYVTCNHTTASVTYFLQAFQTDLMGMYGNVAIKRPVMIIWDGRDGFSHFGPKANTDMGPSTSFVPPFCQSLLI